MITSLEIHGITRRFGTKTAVDSVNVCIAQGQMVGIIGRSGAGKSTMLRMINRLIDPTEGAIVFEGVDVSRLRGSELRRWQRDCAMIFQQFNLVPRLDVLSNVLLGMLNHRPTVLNLVGHYTREERARAIAALERLDIAQTALQPAGTLSGGQQQRVAIARALMQQPKVILADEPIASLDPLNAKVVMDSLHGINRREGLTVITNLHTLDTARAYCDRIIGMAAGRVVFDGTPKELTPSAINAVYGADATGSSVSEEITSTTVTGIRTARPAPAGVLRAALTGT